MNDFTKEELEQLIWLSKNIPYRMSDYPIFQKIQSMIDNYDTRLDYGHLTDKHIGQWADYLIEKYPRFRELESILRNNPEIDEVFLEMYKKGFQDCKTEGGTKVN